MKRKKILAGLLAVLMIGQTAGSVSALTSETSDAESLTFNNEGLWLTEIYQNDVDRSVANNTREKNGYESIRLYNSTDDLMEFLEITSTYKESINLNEAYEVYYNDTLLNITDVNGNSDIIIEPNQSVLLWNCRNAEGGPTEAEFREEMRVDEDAVVLKVNNDVNWKAGSSEFTLKTKADGKVVSTFAPVDKVDTIDGYSVELEVPDFGSEMHVYRELNEPSAGKIYSGQLNGLVQTKVPDATYAEGVYITEVRPNDSDRSGTYDTTTDVMECLEVVNTTDHEIDLNNEYQLVYFIKEGQRKVIQLCHYDETSESHVGSSEGCVIPAGGTAVIWFYKQSYITDYTIFPKEQDLRNTYGIGDDVAVYIFTNQNGVGNTNRGFGIYKLSEDGTKEAVSTYAWVGATDCKNNKSALLAVNPEGPEMLLYSANAGTSMGTVNPAQYTYQQDDGSALTLRLQDGEEVPDSIVQGEEIRVDFYFDVTSTVLPRTGITTYYRFDGEGSWYSSTEANRRVPHLYEVKISADELFNHDYVEFYVSADNRYRSTMSEVYKVNINKQNVFDGIRTNISDGEEVSGVMSVAANDGGDNANSEIYIDGVKQSTVPMLEDGAYFTFHADGRDSYFKNYITTTENEEITPIGKWQYVTLDGQAIRIDNSYFTYNAETNSYDTTLRFWAGTYGTTVDEYLLPSANREDFTVTQLAMQLINGNIYYPTVIGPDNAETSTATNLSTDYSAVHKVGDSAGQCPYMDVSFSIPATEVTAVGAEIDTKTLSDGEHTLKVTDGTNTKEVSFIVDNNAPVIELGVENGADLTGNITFNPQVTEENTLSDVIYTLDGEMIETPYETTAYKLGEGEHTLVAYAEDKAGNYTTETATFTISDVSVAVTDAGTTDITDNSASLYLTVDNTASDTQATFYKAEKVDTADVTTNTSSGILPYIQYTVNVGEVANDDVIIANWDGTASNSDDTHASTMYVLNTVNGKWDKFAKADANGSIENASFIAENHVIDGTATIIVQCTANSSLPDLETETDGALDTNANWDGNSAPEDYDFCFAWETDTQYYAEEYHKAFCGNYKSSL